MKFRPHHFLCTLGFRGKGYSPAFVENYLNLKSELKDSTPIEVVSGLDSICSACPHQSGALCQSQAKIEALDAAHAAVLGLKAGAILTWGEAKTLLAKKMSIQDFHLACTACSWKDLGYCQTALEELHETLNRGTRN